MRDDERRKEWGGDKKRMEGMIREEEREGEKKRNSTR